MTTRVTRARRPKDDPLLALEPLLAKGDLTKGQHKATTDIYPIIEYFDLLACKIPA